MMRSRDYSMRIWRRPPPCASLSFAGRCTCRSYRSQNVIGGRANGVGATHRTDNKNAYQYSPDRKGRLTSPEEFGNIITCTGKPEEDTPSRDVAAYRPQTGLLQRKSIPTEPETPLPSLSISNLSANSLERSLPENIKGKNAGTLAKFPCRHTIQCNLGHWMSFAASMNEVMVTFLPLTLLVVLVLFLFLQNWRAVIIPRRVLFRYHSSARHPARHVAVRLLHQYADTIRTDTCRGHRSG